MNNFLSEEQTSSLWATLTSAACGTALAAAMLYFVRDSIRSFEEEEAASTSRDADARSLAAVCADADLSLPSASVRVGELPPPPWSSRFAQPRPKKNAFFSENSADLER